MLVTWAPWQSSCRRLVEALGWKSWWCWCLRWGPGPLSAHDTSSTSHLSSEPALPTPPSNCSGPRPSTGRPPAPSGWSPSPGGGGGRGARNDFPICYFSFAALLQIGRRSRQGRETYTVDHEVHDGLGHEVCDGLVDDLDVGVHEAADGLHLPLQLWVHGDGVSRVLPVFTLELDETEADRCWCSTSSKVNTLLSLHVFFLILWLVTIYVGVMWARPLATGQIWRHTYFCLNFTPVVMLIC